MKDKSPWLCVMVFWTCGTDAGGSIRRSFPGYAHGGLCFTHFLMKRLRNVRTEMALSVLAYNLTRVMNIIGIRPLIAAIRA